MPALACAADDVGCVGLVGLGLVSRGREDGRAVQIIIVHIK